MDKMMRLAMHVNVKRVRLRRKIASENSKLRKISLSLRDDDILDSSIKDYLGLMQIILDNLVEDSKKLGKLTEVYCDLMYKARYRK